MATATVLYVMQASGNLPATLPAVANNLTKVANAAKPATVAVNSFASAAKSIQSSAAISQLETMGSLFIQVGGNVSRVASLFTSLVRPVATVNALIGGLTPQVAALAGAFGVVTVAAGALLLGLPALARGAVDAADNLRKLNIELDPDKKRNVDAYTEGTKSLAIAFDQLTLSTGSGLAANIGGVKQAFAEFITIVNNSTGAVGELIAKVVEFNREKLGLAPTGNFGLIGDLLQPFRDTNQERARAADLSKKFQDYLEGENKNLQRNGELLKEQIRLLKERANETAGAGKSPGKSYYGAPELGSATALRPYAFGGEVGQILDRLPEYAEKAQASLDLVARIMLEDMKPALQALAVRSVGNLLASPTALLNGLGPIGMLTSAILDLVNNAPALVDNLANGLLQSIAALPQNLFALLGSSLPRIIGSVIPLLASVLATLPLSMSLALIRSIPNLISALITMGPAFFADLLYMIREVTIYFTTGQFISEIFLSFKNAISNIKLSTSTIGDVLGTNLNPKNGDVRIFGVKIPGFAEGGTVARSGLIYAHAGERYLGAPGRSSSVTNTRSSSIVIGQVVAPDVRRFVDELRRAQGNAGLGLTLDPLVG